MISILPGGLVPKWLYRFEVPTLHILDWRLWELNCSSLSNAELLCQTLRLTLPTWAPQEASLSALLMFPSSLTRLQYVGDAPDALPASPILLRGTGAEVDRAVGRWGPSLQPVWLQDGTWIPGVGPQSGGSGVQVVRRQELAPS